MKSTQVEQPAGLVHEWAMKGTAGTNAKGRPASNV
jgi:hypothetical protein